MTDLVDTTTGEIVQACSADEARELTDRIKVAAEATWHLIKEAYEGRAWAALGYSSWDDYCTREFGSQRLRLPREERREVVGSLREAGLSIRAIAAATGRDSRTVQRDLDQVWRNATPERPAEPCATNGHESPGPTKVTGLDGRQYPAAPERPAPTPLTEEQQRELDRREAIQRDQAALRELVNGWIRLVSLPGHRWRDEVLNGLIDEDRQKVLEIEAIYLKGTS